jgi:alanine racemase
MNKLINNQIIRPTYCKIYLAKLIHNYKLIKKNLKKNTKILSVVKANGYGHGIFEVANALETKAGCDIFGVATLEEGIYLRQKGIKAQILVLGSIYPFSSFQYIFDYDLTPTISSYYIAKKLSAYAKNSKKQNIKKISVHVKVDTGMGRIGMSVKKSKFYIDKISQLQNLNIEGVYTHIANASDDKEATLKQIKAFSKLKKDLKKLDIKYFHCANTETIFEYPEAQFDMVRSGLALYGLYSNKIKKTEFKPVMELKSKIVFLKTVPKNTPISYGHTFVTNRRTVIATIAIGYADGYRRDFSNQVEAILRGQRVKQIGRICMDMCMFDVTDVSNVDIGDDIILIGGNIENNIKVDELSKIADTINYEIVTQITNRVPRIYVE